MKTKEKITRRELNIMNNIPFAGTVTLSYKDVSNLKIKSTKIKVVTTSPNYSINIKFYKFIYEIDFVTNSLYMWYNGGIIMAKDDATVYLCYNKKGNVNRIELM